jgi:hypothetical protein
MKRIHLAMISVVVAGAVAYLLLPRRSDLPVATPLEGRAPSRPSGDSSGGGLDSRPPQSVALQTAAEEPEGPITATAQIVRGDNSIIEAKLIDGEFGRIQVEPNEVLTIRLAMKGLEANREVRIEADHGGSLNRKLGPLALRPAPGTDSIEFQYAVGGFRGRYALLVMQGQRQELLEFWAGPPKPQGQPGPYRDFSAARSQRGGQS